MEWISGIIAIVGIVIGFGLGEVSRWIRGLLRIKKLKVLIEDELKAIKYQIPQKRDIIRKIVDAIDNRELLGGSSVRFLNAGYQTYFAEINEHLTPKQRNCIHLIHESLKNIDVGLFCFEEEFRSALNDPAVTDPYFASKAHLQDYLSSLDVVHKLIESYLNGKPIDVFYIEQPFVEDGRFT